MTAFRVLTIFLILGVSFSCRLKPKKKKKTKKVSTSLTGTGTITDSNVVLVPRGTPAILKLVDYDLKPFDQIFPNVIDRFFIDPSNNIYFDFKKNNGKWDLEEKVKAIDPNTLFDVFEPTPEPPNVLFPSKLGIIQMQPARMTNGLIVVFFIDKDKKLKAIKQLAKKSHAWTDFSAAQEIDKDVEFVFPLRDTSPTYKGAIDVVYTKKTGDTNGALKRILVDENKILLTQPEVFVEFTDPKDMGTLAQIAGETLTKSGLMIVSAKKIRSKNNKSHYCWRKS